jgi:F0F1-type ATP synthase membrane subunit c/vacuolar-type H+-ATPase subunit K
MRRQAVKDIVVALRIGLGCLAFGFAIGGFVSAAVDSMPHTHSSVHLAMCGVWVLVALKAWEPLKW